MEKNEIEEATVEGHETALIPRKRGWPKGRKRAPWTDERKAKHSERMKQLKMLVKDLEQEVEEVSGAEV